MKTTKIISSDFLGGEKKLEITYDGEHIHDLILLIADIKNTGNVAIENIDVVIEDNDATYMIPGYIEDIPPGYEKLWSISRTDAEQCTVSFNHINPGQVAKVRLLMDVVPRKEPRLFCPVPNLNLKRVSSDVFPPIAIQILSRLMTSL